MFNKIRTIGGVTALVWICAMQSFAAEITIRGRLGRTVEPGGWLILTDNEKYLLLNAAKYQNQSWFAEGAKVEATGETKKDVITTFQEGVPFQASSLRPIGDGDGATAIAGKRPVIRVLVTGESITSAQPDTAILSISVVNQSKRAIDAQQENASQSEAVIRAIKAATGVGAEVKTSGYSIQPQRVYKENQPPTIVGYEARNTVLVTLADLTRVGAVIDAASAAGANNIDGVSFTLRNDEQAKSQALSEATRKAMAKARALATTLGGRVLRIAEVQEAGFVRPRPLETEMIQTRVAMAGKSTPIEPGTLDVNSQVQLVAEIETNQ
jgi:uncharacterized protein YggE